MKKLSILIALLSLISSQFFASPSFAAVSKKEWLIDQSYNEVGEHKLYLSADAVKIVSEKQGYTVVAKAPSWDAYCYRPDNKKLWIGKLDTFTGDILCNPFALPKYKFDPIKKVADVTYEGGACSSFVTDREGSVVYCTKAVQGWPAAAAFVCHYYNIPKLPEFPVYRKVLPTAKAMAPKQLEGKEWLVDNALKEQRNRPRAVLMTASIKEVPYKATDFDLPREYHKTTEAGDIGVTNAQRSQIGAALDELGFSSDYVRNEKKSK